LASGSMLNASRVGGVGSTVRDTIEELRIIQRGYLLSYELDLTIADIVR